MIFSTLLLSLALASVPFTSALPAGSDSENDAPYICKVRDNTQSSAYDRIPIFADEAKKNIKAAPAIADVTGGYPKVFRAGDAKVGTKDIVFNNPACSHKANMLQFPVYKSGVLYPFWQHPASMRSGTVRAVYTTPGKIFCGVVAYDDVERKGPFKNCEVVKA